ncbi:N-acetylmuramoyl-L-alanine amidase [Roseiarcus sp.]|uniref:N-acetylmuramoyl-L-alanine amidase n=1 Tax=Roseiarcus sp. TaxID=1969460 RepID=UPI003F990184
MDQKEGRAGERMGPARPFAAAAVFALLAATPKPSAAEGAARPVAVGVKLVQDAGAAVLTFDLSRPVDARAHTLASPDRIVVDLPEVGFQLDPGVAQPDAASAPALIKAFRFGLLAPGKSRIVIDLSRRACPVGVTTKPIVASAEPSRLTIDVKPCDDAAFAASAAATPDAPAASPGGAMGSAAPVIVLDPGHGGIDGGAHGVGGAMEKTLAFAFCVELKRQLEATGRYKVLMTRDGDQYVDLDSRVDFARDADAALFVSIHADTLSDVAGVSGSTVYTVADRASDAEAARIAAHENAADRDPTKAKAAEDDPGVADILFDLKRRETRAYSHLFSRTLVEDLRDATRLNHNPERSAGFVVLKAPEFPSVLIELGYLSNAQDVAALESPEWRTRTAAAMTKAIDAFFAGSGATEDAAGTPGVAFGADHAAPTR